MLYQIKQDMHDLAIHDDLITSLITLKVILEDIDKISIVIDLDINNKIKQLEAENIDGLELLQEELKIIALRNRFLGRPAKLTNNRLKKTKKEEYRRIKRRS